jgi:hypothetical protein
MQAPNMKRIFQTPVALALILAALAAALLLGALALSAARETADAPTSSNAPELQGSSPGLAPLDRADQIAQQRHATAARALAPTTGRQAAAGDRADTIARLHGRAPAIAAAPAVDRADQILRLHEGATATGMPATDRAGTIEALRHGLTD